MLFVRQKSVLGKALVGLVVIWHVATTASAQAPIATMDQTPIHAIVSPVTLGPDSTQLRDERGLSELPIRSKVRFASPRKAFRMVIEGVLVGKTAGAAGTTTYANPVESWAGFKCSRIDAVSGGAERGQAGPNGPRIALHVPLDRSILLRLVSESGSADEVDLANIQGPCRRLAYSFRQSRLYLMVDSSLPIRELQFDTQHLDRRFLGVLRVHIVEEIDSDYSILFEEYGEPADEFLETKRIAEPKMGRYLSLEGSDFPFPGDFHVPVGFTMQDPDRGATRRTLSGLKPGQEVKAKVQGVFIFSGFSVPGNPGEKRLGGGGGEQDWQFRFDHVRPRRPPIYPNDSRPYFDSRVILHGARDGFHVQDAQGAWHESLTELKDLRMNHTYEIKFTPTSTEVQFEVLDGGLASKTWDNVGAFFVTVHP